METALGRGRAHGGTRSGHILTSSRLLCESGVHQPVSRPRYELLREVSYHPLKVPPPIPHAESLSSQFEIAGARLADTEIADVPFLYDPATDSFEWGDQPGGGHRTIMPRFSGQGRDPFTLVAGRVFADRTVELHLEYSPRLSSSEERRLIARARIEGVDLLRAWGRASPPGVHR